MIIFKVNLIKRAKARIVNQKANMQTPEIERSAQVKEAYRHIRVSKF